MNIEEIKVEIIIDRIKNICYLIENYLSRSTEDMDFVNKYDSEIADLIKDHVKNTLRHGQYIVSNGEFDEEIANKSSMSEIASLAKYNSIFFSEALM